MNQHTPKFLEIQAAVRKNKENFNSTILKTVTFSIVSASKHEPELLRATVISSDELEKRMWDFSEVSRTYIPFRYMSQTRKTKRHKFRLWDKWHYGVEDKYPPIPSEIIQAVSDYGVNSK